MEIIKKFWGLLLIGLILRLLIAGFTFHPDVVTTAKASALFFNQGTLNFYENSSKIAPGEILDDLPLSYLIPLPVHFLVRPLVVENVENIFFTDRSTLFGQANFWFYLIYAKFPLILFDILLGIVLAATMITHQKKVLLIWMFNPITLWATAAVGQFDIYPAFFILLSWLLIKKGKLYEAAFSLGVGGAIKSSPLLLVPFILVLAKNTRERIILLSLSLAPYLLTVIPYLNTTQFRQDALFAPQLSKMLFATIPLSGVESLFIVPTLLLVTYLIFLSKKREATDFLHYSIVIFLIIFSFSHFHMQWFLWVTPLLIIWLLENWQSGIRLAAFGLFLSWILMLFLFESSLQVKLFAPIFPNLDQALGFKEILTNTQATFLRNIAASIFASSSIYLIWKLIKA